MKETISDLLFPQTIAKPKPGLTPKRLMCPIFRVVTPIGFVPKVAFRSSESKRQDWDDAEAIIINLNLGVAMV